jgi:hypothetical protein
LGAGPVIHLARDETDDGVPGRPLSLLPRASIGRASIAVGYGPLDARGEIVATANRSGEIPVRYGGEVTEHD